MQHCFCSLCHQVPATSVARFFCGNLSGSREKPYIGHRGLASRAIPDQNSALKYRIWFGILRKFYLPYGHLRAAPLKEKERQGRSCCCPLPPEIRS
ncbi:hypothetical protein XELAEV_18022317mg [Xenopus laevis]|uniref:Uncharacterized protein n=1 Tax=Xenopus laevis TaxID=8355 RepID=A0A974D4R2_XENLA|nr:hypothetical protein XELAEV_18022317mg [Xenopus laevis]